MGEARLGAGSAARQLGGAASTAPLASTDPRQCISSDYTVGSASVQVFAAAQGPELRATGLPAALAAAAMATQPDRQQLWQVWQEKGSRWRKPVLNRRPAAPAPRVYASSASVARRQYRPDGDQGRRPNCGCRHRHRRRRSLDRRLPASPQWFARIDSNRSGTLDVMELQKALALGGSGRRRAQVPSATGAGANAGTSLSYPLSCTSSLGCRRPQLLTQDGAGKHMGGQCWL